MTDKKLTDKDLKKASGGGISAQKTGNREGYGTGQVEPSDAGRGETEPNPLPDTKLGEIKGGVGANISAQKTRNREGREEDPEGTGSDRHR